MSSTRQLPNDLLFHAAVSISDWELVCTLICWYRSKKKLILYQLRITSSYGGYHGCERKLDTTPRPREQHKDEWHIPPAIQEKWCDQWQSSPSIIGPFTLLMPSLTHLPAYARISRRSKLRNKILPTHSSKNVPMHSKFQTPIGYKYFFFPRSFFAPSSPRHHFFASPLSFSFFSRRQTSERTNERPYER
jgi:hypothetical protein